MVTKGFICFFWEGITVFKSFVYICLLYSFYRGFKKHAILSIQRDIAGKYILHVVCFTFSSWTIDIIISSMWQYYCSVLPQDLLQKKLKHWKNHQKKIPWRCRPTNKLGRHVGLAIGSQCWSATDGHSRAELPKASCLYRLLLDTSPFPFTSQRARRKQSHRNLSQKIRPHPLNQNFVILRIHTIHPCYIYIYLEPPKTYIFCKQPSFPLSPRRQDPIKHSSHLAFSKAFAFRSGRTWNQLTSEEKKLRQITTLL